jgi:hypothetical protein
MTRDMDASPYTKDEARVAEYLFDRGAGGGDDPIGFMLASYSFMVEERNALRHVIRKAIHELGKAPGAMKR